VVLKAARASQYASLARLILVHGPVLRDGPDAGGHRPEEVAEDASRLADDLEAMGPTFIKLGQLLSTRSDLLPPPHLEALARLQDDIEAVPTEEVLAVFESELGMTAHDAFDQFDPVPLAAASLGQVHRARLGDGRRVVVKIQRPGVDERVASDMAGLRELGRLIDGHTDAGRRYGFLDLLHQFEQALEDELDYRREAANLVRLGEALSDHPLIAVPQPVTRLCTQRVVVMDELDGQKVTGLSPLALLEIDGAGLAEALELAYLDQIFVHGFFHADPHPGNVLLMPDGRIGLIDLGMVGYVRPELRTQLVKLLLSAEEGRGEETGRILSDIGRHLEDFDQERLLREVSAVVSRTANRALRDVRLGELIADLTRLCGTSGLRPPPELSMLARATLNLDAVARALAPDFDPASVIRQRGPGLAAAQLETSRSGLLSAMVDARDFAEALPGRVGRLLDSLVEGDLQVKVNAFDETELLRGIQKVANRVTMGLVISALVLGAAIISRSYPTVALACFIAAAVGGLALILSILAADRHVNLRARRHRK
jgi:ubiquinone biosynthesis protein